LDLDETLVHTVQEKEQWNLIKDTFADRPGEVLHHSFDDKHHVKVVKRPGVLEFLYEMEKHFRLVIFTAGTRSYATPILDWLDPSGALFAARYHQDDCTVHRSHDGTESLVKDLRKLGVSMNQVLLLDNRSMSYHFQKANGVPIPDFFADRNDQVFLQGAYTNILRHASTLEDVRVGVSPEFCRVVEEHQFSQVRVLFAIVYEYE